MERFEVCEMCDNRTPHFFCEDCEELVCLYCEEAYGCFATA